MKYQSLKGMKDILPAESAVWQNVETRIRETLERFGYEEIRTPVLEQAELFIKGSGETTDIVGKEMYTLTDKGENVLALKPEMTPAVVRAYLQHGMGNESPLTKLYYISPMFRQERPQAGRLRQFHQFGVEAIGSVSPRVDVETIAAAIYVYKTFGLEEFIVKINSIGCPACRPKYRELLKSELLKIADQLSPESKQRIETNPLRVLDSKDDRDREATKNAPLILDHLCPECAEHFKEVKKYLDLLGIAYEIDGRIVRGLDYYTKTVYEFISTDLGSQDALGGGGRYDLLVEQMGGKPTPAVGFAAGIERLLIVLEKKNLLPRIEKELVLYIAAADAAARERAFQLVMELRGKGISAECDLTDRSVKAQMREANKRAAQFTVVLGETELQSGKAQLKRMADGTQQEIALDVIAASISKQ
jgi:histidyl-tRNA synthetase